MPTTFVGDSRKRASITYARDHAQSDVARLAATQVLSVELREELNSKLDFFQGAAKDTYTAAIRPALQQVMNRAERIEAAARNSDFTAATQTITGSDKYFDNHIAEVNYHTAEQAVIHYHDGSQLTLGLVPRWMRAPFVEVDYHTPGHEIRPVVDPQTKQVGFILEREIGAPWVEGAEPGAVPRGMPYREFLARYTHPIRYLVEPKSLRIVADRVNLLTAPTLCQVLRDSEVRFIEQAQWAAEWGTGVAGAVGAMPTGGLAKGAGNAVRNRVAKSAATWPASRAARQLTGQLDELVRTGATRTLTVEKVVFSEVRAVKQGRTLAVRRFSSHLPENLRGQGVGSSINAAFEEAAAAAARMNGCKKVTIDVGVIINPGWRELLEKRGYIRTWVENGFGGGGNSWVRTILL